jgi:hypothetical protein
MSQSREYRAELDKLFALKEELRLLPIGPERQALTYRIKEQSKVVDKLYK